MWPFNTKKEEKEDPILENHNLETRRAYDDDLESTRDRLFREYPSAESAIEDYRRGYIGDDKLRLRFSQEEIDLIHSEQEERDQDDKEIPTGGFQ
jgi:hypothetical protein